MHIPLPLQVFVLALVGLVTGEQRDVLEYLLAENRVLREQLGERRLRLTNVQRRTLAEKGHALGRRLLGEVAAIVTPDTILRWYRTLVAEKYTSSRDTRARGDAVDVSELVVRLARENRTWGYTRIRDALANLGHEIGRSTVARILAARGLEPAPERGARTPWSEFLAAHKDVIAAADFFTVEVLTWAGLVRYHVFFVMELATRRVHVAGISGNPGGAWLEQIARNLTDPVSGFLNGKRYLILDRDPLYTAKFRSILEGAGTAVLRLPARSPNLNAHCERFVRSIRSECLDRVVPLGEAHLRRLVAEFVEHYHSERNHQGLEGRLIEPEPGVGTQFGAIVRRKRLGGLLSYYHRVGA